MGLGAEMPLAKPGGGIADVAQTSAIVISVAGSEMGLPATATNDNPERME
jgi:hypothetical protein